MNRNILNVGKYIFKFYDKFCEKISEKYEITNLELKILLFLNTNCGLDTARDMAEKFHLSKSNISDAVDSLTKKGYLKCVQDEKDRRYIHLKLQESANPILEAAYKIHDEYVSLITKGISKERLEIFEETLNQILANIIKESKNM